MQVVRFAKALADETRVRLINLLLSHELNVGEIVEALDMGQSRVSRHLRILAECGLVRVRREGLWAFYSAVEDGPARTFLDAAAALWGPEGEPDPQLDGDLAQARGVIHRRVQDTRRFFDAVAPDWDRLARDILGELDLASEIIALAAGDGPVGVAADLGCGPGDLLARLAGQARAAIGVDNSARMLDLARERFQDMDNVSLRIGELTHLPLRDGEADLAVLSLVLHHLTDVAGAVAEAGRTLGTSGRLIVAEFDLHEVEAMRDEYGDHRLGIEKKDMRRFLERSGFAIQEEKSFPVRRGLSLVLYKAVKH